MHSAKDFGASDNAFSHDYAADEAEEFVPDEPLHQAEQERQVEMAA